VAVMASVALEFGWQASGWVRQRFNNHNHNHEPEPESEPEAS
jgi:hypothetical protein